MLVVLLVFIWQGTDFYQLYRKNNLLVIGSLMFIQTTMTVWTIIACKIFTPYEKGNDLSRYFRNFKNDALLLILVNFINNIWIKGEFLYYGIYKKELDIGSLALLQEDAEDKELGLMMKERDNKSNHTDK